MSGRRVSEKPPVGDLLLIKADVILVCRVADRIVFRLIGLDHDIPGLCPPACAAGRLCEQLEGSLRSPVIISVQGQVRHEDPHQGHAGEIVSFDDHLGPQQDVRFL